MSDNYFDNAFRYLEQYDDYKNNEKLRKRLQGIKQKVAENFMTSGSNYEWTSEKHSNMLQSINDCSCNLISLIILYREVLSKEGKLPIKNLSYEADQFDFIVSLIEDEFIKFMPKGTIIDRHISNSDDEDE